MFHNFIISHRGLLENGLSLSHSHYVSRLIFVKALIRCHWIGSHTNRSAKKSFCCNYPNYTHQIQITPKIGIPFRSNNIRLMEKCLELFNSWLPGCPPVKDTLAHRATTTKITIFNNIFNYLNEIQFKLFSIQFYLNSIHNRTFKLKSSKYF